MKRPLVAVCILSIGVFGFVLGRSADAQTDRQQRHRVPADYMSFPRCPVARAGRTGGRRAASGGSRRDGARAPRRRRGRRLWIRLLRAPDRAACAARRVRIYCVDIQPEMLEIMQQLADEENVTGIEPVLSTPTDPRLAAGAIDWIIIADVYHEMSDPEPMLDRMRESLSPGGQIALLEYRVEDGTGDHVKADHTMSVRQVLSEWQAAGFELVRLHDFLPGQHLFFFRGTADEPGAKENTLHDHDLLDAIDSGVVQAEAVGAGADGVTIRIRRTGAEAIVVTSSGRGLLQVRRRQARHDRQARWVDRARGRRLARVVVASGRPAARPQRARRRRSTRDTAAGHGATA